MAEEALTIGSRFRQRRQEKDVSPSEAAAATRIKVQHIEDMERDDFSGIAAPTYAKGFIKLYAEYLELDPEPLIREYLERHAPERPPLTPEAGPRDREYQVRKALKAFSGRMSSLSPGRAGRYAGLILAVLAVVGLVLLIANGVGSCRERLSARRSRESGPRETLREPPAPYLDRMDTAQEAPGETP